MQEEAPQQEQRQLRSVPGAEEVCIRFFNFTSSIVDVIWIDFSGAYKSYQLLRKGQFLDVYTYTKHPWVALDHKTKQRLLIDKSFVYFPKTPIDYIRLRRGITGFAGCITGFASCINRRTAIPANITSPLYSLRYATLLMLSQFFRTLDSVDGLELPKELKDDLKKIITQRINDGEVLPR